MWQADDSGVLVSKTLRPNSMVSQSVDPNDWEPILNACSSGDIARLKRLLEDIGPQPGSDCVGRQCQKVVNTAAVHELLAKAVSSKQAATTAYLLKTYPWVTLCQAFEVVQAVLDNPDADTLRPLCAHDKSFASFSIDYHMQCFITEACARPPEQIVPVLHVLLDCGADVNDGWGPGGGALYAAILGSQPAEIIDKIFKNGGMISTSVIYAAVKNERLDVLPKLLRGTSIGSEDLPRLIEIAEDRGNKRLIAMIEDFGLNQASKMRRPLRHGHTKSWWQVWKSG